MGRWSHQRQYWGTWTGSSGKSKAAYVQYDDTKKGFILRDTNGRPIVPTVFHNFGEIVKSTNFVIAPKSKDAAPAEIKEAAPAPVAA